MADTFESGSTATEAIGGAAAVAVVELRSGLVAPDRKPGQCDQDRRTDGSYVSRARCGRRRTLNSFPAKSGGQPGGQPRTDNAPHDPFSRSFETMRSLRACLLPRVSGDGSFADDRADGVGNGRSGGSCPVTISCMTTPRLNERCVRPSAGRVPVRGTCRRRCRACCLRRSAQWRSPQPQLGSRPAP